MGFLPRLHKRYYDIIYTSVACLNILVIGESPENTAYNIPSPEYCVDHQRTVIIIAHPVILNHLALKLILIFINKFEMIMKNNFGVILRNN